MNWKCPDDWKYMPETRDADDGIMMALLFGGSDRFQHIRSPRFRRCNASGRWIWPLQKAWCGVVGIRTGQPNTGTWGEGTYKIVWLNEDQYLIQKLKGNI